jgi:high-affinity iron transporter
MISSFVITFREMLEAALIVGIILSYLARTKQSKYDNVVYVGIGAGIIASVIGAWLFVLVAGGFEGTAEQIFGGVTTLVGAALLTTMILWMRKQKNIAGALESRIAEKISGVNRFGLFSLVFVSVFREGIETVIFLGAANFVSSENNIVGALLGIVAAVILGYLIFVGSMKINLKKFFSITGILLIIFAAGLVAHGIDELQEAGIVQPVVAHLWDLNPPLNPDGTFPLLHEDGLLGSILHDLFGYVADPSLIEVASYAAYILLVFVAWRRMDVTAAFKK